MFSISKPGLITVLAACVFVALCVESMLTNTVTVDEFAHVPAGVSHWETGDFSLYHENPPFVRCLVGMPVWLDSPFTNYRQAVVGHGLRNEWQFALDFVLLNQSDYDRLFLMARSIVLGLSLLCSALIFLWARQEYGATAACVSSLLWMTDPNIAAHSSIATLDVGAAAVGCLASYVFWRYLHAPNWFEALMAGFCLGVAQASKFSLLTLYPTWAIVFVVACARALPVKPTVRGAAEDRDRHVSRTASPSWQQAAAILALSVLTLNACYLFEGSFTRLGTYAFKSRLFTGSDNPLTPMIPGVSGENRFRDTPLSGIPVPIPRDYVIGFDSQKRDEESRLANLDSGRLVDGGAWYSPLVTLLYKLPPGTLLILSSAAIFWVWGGCRANLRTVVLVTPALALLGLLCMQTGLNWAVRYTLPALPYLFIATGGLVRTAWTRPVARFLIVTCLAWNVVEMASIRPYHLSYGNPLVGGTDGAEEVPWEQLRLGSRPRQAEPLVRYERGQEVAHLCPFLRAD